MKSQNTNESYIKVVVLTRTEKGIFECLRQNVTTLQCFETLCTLNSAQSSYAL